MNYALLFPGQGSHYKQLADNHSSQFKTVRQTIEEASDIVGFSITDILKQKSMKEITFASLAQPIVVAYSIAFYRDLISKTKYAPRYVIGHSLGEISAYVVAGIISFEEAMLFTVNRGKIMEAIGDFEASVALALDIDLETLKSIVEGMRSSGKTLYVTGYNSIKQFIVCGNESSLSELDDAIDVQGGQLVPFRMMPMKDARPYHSPYMSKLVIPMSEALKKISPQQSSIEVYSTIKNGFLNDMDNIQELLAIQLENPVFWLQGVKAIMDKSIDFMVDMGPSVIMRNLVNENQLRIKCFGYDNQIEQVALFNYLEKEVKDE